ncbi:MAG: 8-amino-7-oxononanoate synthase [Planctomycetota bacterium]
MHDALDWQLRTELDERARRGLKRATMLDGQIEGVDFGSNDYLGLARDSSIADAMVAAVREFGAGGRSARLLKGGSPLHEQCEQAAATWLGSEAALLFPSGYQANIGLVGALVGRGDAVISDRDNHASLIDAARLSRARILVHDHLDLAGLERALRAASSTRRRLVLTEGVFSMTGDAAPLLAIDALCREYDAWLVIDEAHSVGLLGPSGAGAWAREVHAAGGADGHRLCARVVTGGKALGVAGAFVVGSSTLREQLIHKARSFLFTTASPPALAGGLLAAVECCRLADRERAAVFANAARLAAALDLPVPAAAIVPVPVGDAALAVQVASELQREGFYAPAVRPPTVAPGASRLRVVCHANQSTADVDRLAGLVASKLRQQPAKAAVVARRAPVTCVVGTDTGVGKTVVSALLLRAAMANGPARYWKPVQTGSDDDTQSVTELAAAEACHLLPNAVNFELPASPHAAAAAEGASVQLEDLHAALQKHRAAHADSRLLVEFAGGLLVPFALEPPATQADWLASMGAQVVLVARSGLGTLNHTLLTVEAMRARQLQPDALFLVGEPHPSNRETLGALTSIAQIYEVPHWPSLSTKSLDAWLQGHDLTELLRV